MNATKTKKTFPTRIDLAAEVRGPMIALLNQQLAGTFDLYSQTKQAHWNVKGAQFYAAPRAVRQTGRGVGGLRGPDRRAGDGAGRAGPGHGAPVGRQLATGRVPAGGDGQPPDRGGAGRALRRPGCLHAEGHRGRRTARATRTPQTCSRRCRGDWTRPSGSWSAPARVAAPLRRYREKGNGGLRGDQFGPSRPAGFAAHTACRVERNDPNPSDRYNARSQQ